MRLVSSFLMFFCIQAAYATGFKLEHSLSFSLNGNVDKKVNIIIPFKQGDLSSHSKFKLLHEGINVAIETKTHLLWPATQKAPSSVRALSLTFKQNTNNNNYRLFWKKTSERIKFGFFDGEYVDVNFHNDWLAYTLYSPLKPFSKESNFNWYSYSFQKYGEFITNNNAVIKSTKNKLSFNNASPWLYDRPYTLYLLYLKTGDLKWKFEAHNAALFYMNNINTDGYFELKKRADLKYLIPSGLLIDYLFFPSYKTLEIIELMYNNSIAWPLKYDQTLSFWTERNLATALSLALVLWEITEKKEYKERLENLIEASFESIYIPPNREGGCIKHYYSAHEGAKDDTLICSPWMSALVVEQLWRYYSMTNDTQSASLIDSFGTHVANGGTYKGSAKHLKDFDIPYYLRFFGSSKYNMPNQWTDIQHACDIGAMVAKSAYVRKKVNKNINKHIYVADNLMASCEKTMIRAYKLKVWAISPLRKFNWWFSSTSDIEWIIEQIK